MNKKSKYDFFLAKRFELYKLYTRSTDLRIKIFNMRKLIPKHNSMMDDTIEQMRQEMISIDQQIKIIEAEVKVIKSDPSNYYQ